jgi:phage terminase small subunit
MTEMLCRNSGSLRGFRGAELALARGTRDNRDNHARGRRALATRGRPRNHNYQPKARKGDVMSLNARQRKFVVEYLKDNNATQAAARAGYSARSAKAQGTALLSHPTVKAEIAEKLRLQEQRLEIKADDILRELMRIGLADVGEAFDEEGALKSIREIPEHLRRAISAVDVEEIWEGRGEERRLVGYARKIRFWSKTASLDKLGRHLRLFGELTPPNADDSARQLRELMGEMDDADGL